MIHGEDNPGHTWTTRQSRVAPGEFLDRISLKGRPVATGAVESRGTNIKDCDSIESDLSKVSGLSR